MRCQNSCDSLKCQTQRGQILMRLKSILLLAIFLLSAGGCIGEVTQDARVDDRNADQSKPQGILPSDIAPSDCEGVAPYIRDANSALLNNRHSRDVLGETRTLATLGKLYLLSGNYT